MKATIHYVEHNESEDIILYRKEDVELPTKKRLEFLQEKVGGLIDIYHHNGRDWVLNDEGILLYLPLNIFAFENGLKLFGTIVEVHGILD